MRGEHAVVARRLDAISCLVFRGLQPVMNVKTGESRDCIKLAAPNVLCRVGGRDMGDERVSNFREAQEELCALA
jgi:hypothetical protein